MSKLPPLKRLVLEDFPSEVQEWAPKLIEPLNQFMAAVSGGLDRKLTLAENCVAQFRTLTISIDGDSGGNTTANGSGTAGSLAKWTGDDALGDASAADVLTILKTVDGTGSGLDADTVDGQHASAFAPVASPSFTGDVNTTGSFISSDPDGLRIAQSSYGAIFRNDNTKFYLLFTASGDPLGTWSDRRPFSVDMETGAVSLSNGATTTTPASGDSSTKIATTAFVQDAVSGGAIKSGVATMASGATSKAVAVSGMTSSSKVVATPDGPTDSGGWYVTTAAGSFTIHTPTSSPFDIDFMWVAIL